MALEELQNGRYRFLRLLGSGGMGDVYLMEDTRVNRQVAIKIIRSENPAYADQERVKEAARLFQREARAIAALEHPNILPLYDFGEEELDEVTVTYMVMPYCSEGSLVSWLRQRNTDSRLTPQDVAYFVDQAAEALQCAHDQQVIHLDVKPSNFLLRSNRKKPEHPMLLLADFGIARSFTTIANSSRTIRGTPTSMAPEQWSGEPVLATDQYALAVMAYEMLAGQPPFVGSMEQLMYRHFAVEPPPPSKFNPQLSAAIDAVLMRALRKKPAERFPSIVAFANAFAEAAQEPASEQVSINDIRPDVPARLPEPDPDLSQVLAAVGGEQTVVPQRTEKNGANRENESGGEKASMPPGARARSDLGGQLKEVRLSAEAEIAGSVQEEAYRELQRSSEHVSEHNSPTFSVTQEPQQSQARSSTRERSSGLRLVSIILAAVLLIALLGSATYFISNHQNDPRLTANTGNSTPKATTKATSASTPVSTPTPVVTPTPPPGLYIAGSYNGTMQDTSAYQTTQISVHLVQSKGSGVLTGSVKFSPPSTTYELSGTVDGQGKFGFTVQQDNGQKPLYFYGDIQQQYGDTYLHGNFCRSDTNSCPSNAGYFNVGPRF